MVFGEGGFLSVICKDFLHLCGCLALHCFLEASSIYSSVTEMKEVQRLIMKVVSNNMCCFPVSFIILMELVKIVHFSKEKAMYKYIDITVKTYEEYLEISFFG